MAKIDTTNSTAGAIGRMVAFHRRAAGLSRLDLADLAGIGKTALFDIERGKATVRFETLRRALAALNITLRFESPLMSRFEEEPDAER